MQPFLSNANFAGLENLATTAALLDLAHIKKFTETSLTE